MIMEKLKAVWWFPGTMKHAPIFLVLCDCNVTGPGGGRGEGGRQSTYYSWPECWLHLISAFLLNTVATGVYGTCIAGKDHWANKVIFPPKKTVFYTSMIDLRNRPPWKYKMILSSPPALTRKSCNSYSPESAGSFLHNNVIDHALLLNRQWL